ncbi:MAG: hypothetical protein ACRD9W_23555, partial [Terriglobia bacterium]
MLLPPQTEIIQASGNEGNEGSVKLWSCVKSPLTSLVPSTATCSREDSLAPQASYPPIIFVAQVHGDASDTLVTKACASGGGAANVPCDEETVSGIAPAIPFGFAAFETNVFDAEGEDFTQAGGHPYEVDATFDFTDHAKAQPSAEAGFRAANGHAREIRTDAPPGFIGDVEALEAKCPSTEDVVAIPSRCPASSAVGGITIEAESGTFVDQPIYAIEPEKGTPAQLAFGVAALKPGFSFTLTPELRPEDHYGITLVAAPAPRTPELFGVDATLCGHGAEL